MNEPCGSSQIARLLLKAHAPYRICDLAVNGTDLKAMGINGKDIGKNLKNLLRKVTSGELENDKNALLDSLKNKNQTDR